MKIASAAGELFQLRVVIVIFDRNNSAEALVVPTSVTCSICAPTIHSLADRSTPSVYCDLQLSAAPDLSPHIGDGSPSGAS